MNRAWSLSCLRPCISNFSSGISSIYIDANFSSSCIYFPAIHTRNFKAKTSKKVVLDLNHQLLQQKRKKKQWTGSRKMDFSCCKKIALLFVFWGACRSRFKAEVWGVYRLELKTIRVRWPYHTCSDHGKPEIMNCSKKKKKKAMAKESENETRQY